VFKVDVEMHGDPKLFTRRALRGAHLGGMRHVGHHWHGNLLPMRFEPGAENRFLYARRSRVYQGRKEALGKRPLEWTGRLKRSTATVEIRATPKRVRVKMFGLPEYIQMNRKTESDRERIYQALRRDGVEDSVARLRAGLDKSATTKRYPDIKAELTRAMPWELRALLKIYNREANEVLKNDPAAKKTVRRRKIT
jgi:hypothetical protein